MFNKFYERYLMIKNNNLSDKIILIFDEFASYSLFIEKYDRTIHKDSLNRMAEILMMGRVLGSNKGGAYIWTVLQRPDALYFGNGARDNYFVKICMKEVSKSIRTMLDINEDDIPSEHIQIPGHGICVVDDEIYPFIVPSYDIVAMDALLKAERKRSRKQG